MTNRRRARWILLSILAVIVAPSIYSRCASPFRRVRLHSGPTEGFDSVASPSGTLRVACYNIAHGRGLAESNWDGGEEQQRIERLNQIADLLARIDADVVVLNEVDFDASWSNGVNQAAYLADRAGYPCRVEQRNVDLRVGGWTWKFGNAVLSRRPITEATVIEFPAYSPMESWLLGHKRGLLCEIDVGDGTRIDLLAVHLSHRSERTRVDSMNRMSDHISRRGHAAIVAGDFNSTPSGYPEHEQDSEGRNAIDQIRRGGFLHGPSERASIEPSDFTFHADKPTRVIDWIFVSQELQIRNYAVEFSTLSDHRPVVAEVTRKDRD